MNSISQIYSASPSEGVLVWNDEAPGSKSEDKAHAKGMLYFDDSTGMYLVHSAPNFPGTGSYNFPTSASDYGQSFLCISIDSEAVGDVISGLIVTRPQLYMSSAGVSLKQQFLPLAGLLNGNYTKVPTGTSYDLQSVGGVDFTVFIKNREWDSFLYEDLVAPTLDTDLIAETWTNGAIANIDPSFCKNESISYNVWNAMHISFDGTTSWARTKDHSKWAVGVNSDWMCIGGINRQLSQNNRGGGTVCTQQLGLQKTFHSAVIDVNACGTSQVGDQGSSPPTLLRAKKIVIN